MDAMILAIAAFLPWLASVYLLLIQKREPSSTVAWILFVTMAPILGPFVFFLIGRQRWFRKAIKRRKLIPSKSTLSDEDVMQYRSMSDLDYNILSLATRASEYCPTSENVLVFLPDPGETLNQMRAAIQGAKEFVHLEYYIIANDEVTQALSQDLISAAKRGVEVRVLYDSFGSLSLRKYFLRNLTQGGVKIAGFLPFSLIPQHFNINFRNHRKILIIDGKDAYTGGVNIGRKYLGTRTKNQWHDYSVKVTGPACRQLQDVFAKDWYFTTREELFDARYYPNSESQGSGVVQVLESGPDSSFRSLHKTTFLAVSSARRSIMMTTPYFIPDPAIKVALTVAAMRGVSVQLILPAKTDAPLVQLAARSFYEDLLKAGVKIYEFQPRVLHAKLLVVDDKWTMLGSGNMDIRSFRLNFELNLMIMDTQLAETCRQTLEEDIQESQLVTWELYEQRPLIKRLAENSCRLLSPIL